MVERERNIVDRDPHKERRTRIGEWDFTVRHGASVRGLLRGKFPDRGDLHDREQDAFYTLAQESIAVVTAERGGHDKEYLVIGPKLAAKEVNELLYYAAPNKHFGLNTYDILADWKEMAEAEARETPLAAAHAEMAGWGKHASSRGKILRQLRDNYKGTYFRDQDPSDLLVPLLRFRKDAKGKTTIVLDNPDDGLDAALEQLLPMRVLDKDRLDNGLGLMFLAAVSPDQTQWPPRSGVHSVDDERTNEISPTQVLGFGYREVERVQEKGETIPDNQNLLQSPLLHAIETYAETGKFPKVRMSKVSERQIDRRKTVLERRIKRRNRIGAVLFTLGGALTVPSSVDIFNLASDGDTINANYAYPSRDDAKRAEGSIMTLYNLRTRHPELAPEIDPQIKSAQDVFEEYFKNETIRTEEMRIYNRRIDRDVTSVIVGTVLLLGGVISRRSAQRP